MATHPFSRLPDFFRALGDSIPEAAAGGVSEATKVVGRAVVLDTPVDTGLHRSNWVATIGAPFGGVRAAYFPGQKLGKGERANAAAAIQQIEGTAARYRLRNVAGRADQPVYITNNAPAIGRLNSGRSAQTPPSFVQRSLKFAGRVTGQRMTGILRASLAKRGF